MPKTAVLVIDMQKDFTRPEGRFYYPETTGEMMKTFPEKLNKMRDLGALVVIVYTAHPADEKSVPARQNDADAVHAASGARCLPL